MKEVKNKIIRVRLTQDEYQHLSTLSKQNNSTISSLRLLKQVFVMLLKLNFILIVCITLGLSAMKISDKETRTMFTYLIASIYTDLGKKEYSLQLEDNSVMSAEQFIRKYKSKVHYTTSIAWRNLIFATKVCGCISVKIGEYRQGLSYGAHEMRDGVNLNKMRQNRQLVLPSKLINLKDKEGYFCMAKGFNIAKVEFEYKEWSKVNERIIEIESPLKKHNLLEEENEEGGENDDDIIKKLYK